MQAGLKVVMDREKQRVGFSVRDSEVWRSYDPDLAVLQLRHQRSTGAVPFGDAGAP